MLLKKELEDEIEKEKFSQFIFNRQWTALKKYANTKGVQIIGDMPIYVDFESSDVWANPHIFKLDSNLRPLYVSGVPPDYFSANGQLWNNPVYDWAMLEKDGFKWWINRIYCNLLLFDITRIDHFRGFCAYWQVSAGKRTAKEGSWACGRADSFFDTALNQLGSLPVIAENLGVITADVEGLMKKYGFPGIKVLQFAFGSDYPESVHLPHNYEVNSVVYTGTHDNNTLLGWYKRDAKRIEKQNLSKYTCQKINHSNICEEAIKLALSSRAALSIIPLQDILELDWRARMNHPSTIKNNWIWQATDKNMGQLEEKHASRLYGLALKYGRF
jgi:4-alpha-glucanotransferase